MLINTFVFVGGMAGQETPGGYNIIERMLKLSAAKGVNVKICGTCALAAGRSRNSALDTRIGSHPVARFLNLYLARTFRINPKPETIQLCLERFDSEDDQTV